MEFDEYKKKREKTWMLPSSDLMSPPFRMVMTRHNSVLVWKA